MSDSLWWDEARRKQIGDDPSYHDGYKGRVRDGVRNSISLARAREEARRAKGKPFADVTLTMAQAEAMLQEQDYRCLVTRLVFWSMPGRYSPASPTLDRIRPGGPYSAANVRIVVRAVNNARGDGTDADLITIAEAIVANKINVIRWSQPSRAALDFPEPLLERSAGTE